MYVAFPRHGDIQFQDWVDFKEGQQQADTRLYLSQGVDFICLPSEPPENLPGYVKYFELIETLRVAFRSCINGSCDM